MKSDNIRIALLKKYGGVYMDPSIVLLKPISKICGDF
jgi:mannosyltransferase OCH1-like enzyme